VEPVGVRLHISCVVSVPPQTQVFELLSEEISLLAVVGLAPTISMATQDPLFPGTIVVLPGMR